MRLSLTLFIMAIMQIYTVRSAVTPPGNVSVILTEEDDMVRF